MTEKWYNSSGPIFSADGKHLYFNSDRDFNPTYGSLGGTIPTIISAASIWLSSQPTPLAAPPHRRRDPLLPPRAPTRVLQPFRPQWWIPTAFRAASSCSPTATATTHPSMPTARAMCGIRRAAV